MTMFGTSVIENYMLTTEYAFEKVHEQAFDTNLL